MQEKRDSLINDHSQSSFAQFLNSKNFLESSKCFDPDKMSPFPSNRVSSNDELQEQISQLQKIRFSVENSADEIQQEKSKEIV